MILELSDQDNVALEEISKILERHPDLKLIEMVVEPTLIFNHLIIDTGKRKVYYSVMDAIIDKFGIEAKTYAYDMTSFKLEVNVAVNHVFFGWVFGFGGLVKIKSPENIRQQYIEMVQKTLVGLD